MTATLAPKRRRRKAKAQRPEGVKVTAKVYDEENPITITMAEKWLKSNVSNRPLRKEIARRYALEILRGKWRLNGESIVFDWNEHLQEGQHRLSGLLLAEEMRTNEKTKDKWRAYGWTGPVWMQGIVIKGVDPESADTLNIGQTRTGGDVLFRQHRFDQQKYTLAQQKTLTKDLASAVRLVWLRSQGQIVSDAPKFPHTEMLDFLAEHPGIKGWVEYVWEKEAGAERNVSSRVSRAYMAAMAYLYEQSFEKESEGEQKASAFVDDFARGSDLQKTDPVFQLREAFTRLKSQGHAAGAASGRDLICGMIVNAMNLHREEKPAKAADLKVKKGDDPRLGGLDRSREEVLPAKEADEEETAEEG